MPRRGGFKNSDAARGVPFDDNAGMHGRDDSASTGTAPARRRGRRGWWVLLALVFVLIGRGLGWLGGGGAVSRPNATQADLTGASAQGSRAEVAEAPAPLASVPGASRAADAAPDAMTAGPAPAPAGPPDGEPGSAPAGEAAPQSAPLESPAPAVDPDRFASLVSLVRTRTDERQLGSAMGALQHLRSLPLDAAQRTVLSVAADELQTAMASACSHVVQSLCQGQVLSSCDEVARLLADGPQLVQPLLLESLRVAGIAGDLLRAPVRDERPWPVPPPLPRDRRVRLHSRDGVQLGRVVDSRSDQATLRVQGAAGVTFPTVAVVALEPVDATPAEAIEMGFAALHAGNVLLARLWLAAAGLRGAGPLPARGEQLAAALR